MFDELALAFFVSLRLPSFYMLSGLVWAQNILLNTSYLLLSYSRYPFASLKAF